jgi:hypothetical protein
MILTVPRSPARGHRGSRDSSSVAAWFAVLLLLATGTVRSQPAPSPSRSGEAELPVTDGLRLWFRADRGVETEQGLAVKAWHDLSGAGHSAIQQDSTRRPRLIQSSIQGKPAVRFDGEDDVLGIVDVSGEVMTSLTVFIVHRLNRRSGSQSYTGDYFVMRLGGDGDRRYQYWGFETLGSAGGGSNSLVDVLAGWGNDMRMRKPGISTFGKATLWCATTDGAIHRTRMYADGVECQAKALGVDGPIRIKLGNADGTGGGGLGGTMTEADRGHCSASEIAEVIVFNRVLSAEERAKLERQLGQRYSLQISTSGR